MSINDIKAKHSNQQNHPFKRMEIDDIISISYNVRTQRYVHTYGDAVGKLFRTKQFKKGILTITRKL